MAAGKRQVQRNRWLSRDGLAPAEDLRLPQHSDNGPLAFQGFRCFKFCELQNTLTCNFGKPGTLDPFLHEPWSKPLISSSSAQSSEAPVYSNCHPRKLRPRKQKPAPPRLQRRPSRAAPRDAEVRLLPGYGLKSNVGLRLLPSFWV